jgi:glycosyltransferase involved in cell wall biosynthesis
MKLVLISNFFPPTHTAGTEKRTFGYARTLQARHYDVQVLCAGQWSEGERYWNGYVDEVHHQVPVRRIQLNWTRAPDPNRFLYRNPVVAKQVGAWLAEWKPDLVHITSCNTLSASVIQAAKDQQIPVVLTLTDFWFICPRVTLLHNDGSLCDGRTTSWDCLKCMLWNTKAYRGLRRITTEKSTATVLEWASKQPSLSRLRGLRGMALDMADRKSHLMQMLNAADWVTVPSTSLGNIITNSGVSRPLQVIQSGHDLAWLATLSKQKKPAGSLRIGYIGQITAIKGVHLLLSAFTALSSTEQAQLSIYGDPSKAPQYAEQLKSLSAGYESSISFCGSFPPERLGEVLSELDLLVVPSQWHENNPRVIQEAFASKTPVIASNVAGISEYVEHEVNGLLFERDRVDDLAHQLKRVITEPHLLARLQAGIKPVKTIAEEVTELEVIYRNLVSSN